MNTNRTRNLILGVVMLAAGIFLSCKAIELTILFRMGSQTQAVVTGVFEERHSRGGTTYSLLYEFQTPDKTPYTGLDSYHKKLSKYQRVPILYLPLYPELNRIEMTLGALLLLCSLWGVPGLLLFALGIRALWLGQITDKDALDPDKISTTVLAGVFACFLGLGVYVLDVPGLVEFGVTESPEQTTPVPPDGVPGNTPGNLLNDGLYARAGEWLLYVDVSKGHGDGSRGIYRIRPDGTGREKLADGPTKWLNVIGDAAFFVKWEMDKGDTIHRLSLADGAVKRLLSDRVMCLIAQGEWLYFTCEREEEKLYRARLDGSTKQLLSRDTARSVTVAGSWIYYSNNTDRDRPYRIHTNGTDRHSITDIPVQELFVHGEWLYFRDMSNEGMVSRISLDGGEIVPFGVADAHWLNADASFLYYSDYKKDGALFRIPHKGGTPEPVYSKNGCLLHLIDSYLYFGAGDFMSPAPMRVELNPIAKPEPFPPVTAP